jgi:PAS domain S-box-containing protein
MERNVPCLLPQRDGLSLVLETSLDAVVVMKPDGTVAQWNDRAAKVFGWSRGEAVGRIMADLIIPERFRDKHVTGIQRYLETGNAEVLGRRIEIAGLRKNGEEFPIELSIAPVQNDADTLFVGCLRDISERRKAEERARRAEEELRATIDTIPALAARHRADGIIDFVNQTWRSFTGLSQENWKDRGSIITHPDDRPQVDQAWLEHLKTGEPFETEQRLLRADGEYRWHCIRRVPLRDDHGDVIAWYGAGYDIHDRKLTENALRASEAKLADAQRELRLIIDSIPAMVGTYETDGTRTFVNQTWRDFTGLTGEERNTIYFHSDDIDRYENTWRTSIAKGTPFAVDVRARAANGEYRWHTHRRVPRRNENGEIVKWYSVGTDIHDQKIAEEALLKSEAQLADAERELRLTLDLIPTLAWRAHADGLAEYLNKRWLDYTGLSQEQALGWDWQAAVHPDDRPILHNTWLRMLASGRSEEVEARMRRFDGTYRWFLFRAETLRDERGTVVGWYGTNTDIQDRKQAESALRRSEAYSSEAQKLSQTGSIAWEIASDALFWSDETYQILGYDRSVKPSIDLIKQRVHPDDRVYLQNEIHRMSAGAENCDCKCRMLMPDGKIKDVHIRAHGMEKGEIVGALMDITATKKSQEALDAAKAALAHASRVATLGEISATIAHEVNQPLGAIVANGQACLRFLRRETPDLNDVRGAVEWIVRDGNRASQIIQRVRGLLKNADADKMLLDLNDVTNEVAALLQRELTAQGVTPRLEVAPDLPAVIGDRVQLQQVIINLIMNGVDAMKAIVDRPRALAIRVFKDEAQWVVLAVKDSGIGVPAEATDRLFEPFFSTKPSGLGMGLSICRSIIHDHGGRLWATNNGETPGATFQFALPSQRVAPDARSHRAC